jgi:hypothetical protein
VAQAMEWPIRMVSGSVPVTMMGSPPPVTVKVSASPLVGAVGATATGTSMVSLVPAARAVVRVQVKVLPPAVQFQPPDAKVEVLTVTPAGSVPLTVSDEVRLTLLLLVLLTVTVCYRRCLPARKSLARGRSSAMHCWW